MIVDYNHTPDYTPTTEEVRKDYWIGTAFSKNAMRTSDKIREEAAFDRWLAEVKAQAWQEGWDTKPPYQEINNPYRQRERSGNSNSQPTAETSNLLNKGEI